ncbi:MAG: M23 family metallopeptidase [bacterium]|nr:M23 family metallopeptidase [bacterium]
MFKKRNRAPLRVWRVLPQRNEQSSFNFSNTLALPYPIWYSSEVIIFDALSFAADLLWLWKVFTKVIPVFLFRTFALALLAFVVFGFNNRSQAIVTDNYKAPLKPATDLQVTIDITARKAPVIVWPVPKSYISTYFSFYHQGIDIPASYGAGVKAYSEGKIIFAGWSGGFGKMVVIAHPNGYFSKYAHLSDITVTKGADIQAGSLIGKVGMTGHATGPHLHFEIHGSGPINPLTVLP